jgi:hypothetical protein
MFSRCIINKYSLKNHHHTDQVDAHNHPREQRGSKLTYWGKIKYGEHMNLIWLVTFVYKCIDQ